MVRHATEDTIQRPLCHLFNAPISNWTTAFPIARKHNIPLSIFVCPGLVGCQSPFWPERVVALCRRVARLNGGISKIATLLPAGMKQGALRRDGRATPELLELVIEGLKTFAPAERERRIGELAVYADSMPTANDTHPMDATARWEDLLQMEREGVTFGSHTQSHQILTQVPLPVSQAELVESKQEIQSRLRNDCLHFAYPNGDWSIETRDLVAKAGYQFAFTTQIGAWTKECDPLLIPRVTVWEGTLVGPRGRFSRIAFEYSVFWKAYRRTPWQVSR